MKTTLLLFAAMLLFGCSTNVPEAENRAYEIVFDEGIFVERFDSTHKDENRYTANNEIYTAGTKMTYSFYYEDRKGERYVFAERDGASELPFRERAKAWYFVGLDSLTDKSINQVMLKVKEGREPMKRNSPDYNQTVISYYYPQINGEQNFNESTGLIENEKNIWAHPPRQKFFRILELNPFPFIMAPYETGTKWNWSLKVGSFWGDDRWATWEGSLEIQYQYEITGRKKIQTSLGEFECQVVTSTATSRIGETSLTAYFNQVYGFVKLAYINIDSTRTVLELVAFERERQ